MASKSCMNCVLYSWGEEKTKDEEKSPVLLKCSKCKFVYYCSKQCQLEHWEKVHSAQCKYLAGVKALPLQTHEDDKCPSCIQESVHTRGGSKRPEFTALARTDNPEYGCAFWQLYINILPCKVYHEDFMDGGRFEAPLPFPLPEMTGQFRTRAEKCLALMQGVHYKLSLTGHPVKMHVTKGGPANGQPLIFMISSVLAELRATVWNVYWHAVPGTMTDRLVYQCMNMFVMNMNMEMSKDMGHGGFVGVFRQLDFENHFYTTVPKQFEHFNAWDTLLLLYVMANIPSVYLKDLAGLSAILPSEVQELLASSPSVDQLEVKVDKLTGFLSTGLVPFINILKVLCDGELAQTCSHCHIPATVCSLFTCLHSGMATISRGRAFVTFSGFETLYCCGNAACSREVIDRMTKTAVVLTSAALIVESKYEKFTCDNCNLVGGRRGKGHRCSKCLTKLYCSEECMEEDAKVHVKICRKREVEWKKKEARSERKEQGKRMSEVLMNQMKNTPVGIHSHANQVAVSKLVDVMAKMNI